MSEPEQVRDVDRRNGNAARARRQAAEAERHQVDASGNVRNTTATSLVVPEEKRCTAMTVRGERCKVARMRGISFCMFHAHLAASDEQLEAIATGEKPRLSPRKALQAVVALRAEELAEAAVRGALDAEAGHRTRAVLALVDATDPLVSAEATLTLTPEGVQAATFRQLAAVYGHTP